MRSKRKLEYYVYIENFNNKKIEPYNVLNEGVKNLIIKKAKREKPETIKDLKEIVRIVLLSKYRSRAEYEIFMTSMFRKDVMLKICAFKQLGPNLDLIVDYINKELEIVK